MANKIIYQIVGRYMSGKEVTGYHIQCAESGKNGKYTREQVCYLVGRNQISNCSGQIYQDKVLLRGVGISLEDLPIQQDNGAISRTDSVGKVRRGATAGDVMNQLMLVGAIVDGRNTVGYKVANAGGAVKSISRSQTLELAKQGRLGNARCQEYDGKTLLRGIGINLNELPVTKYAGATGSQASAPKPVSNDKPVDTPVTPVKKPQDDEVMFKIWVKEAFDKLNSQFGNKLVADGFPMNDEFGSESHDSLVLFRFHIAGHPRNHGGCLQICDVEANEGKRTILMLCGKFWEDNNTQLGKEAEFNTGELNKMLVYNLLELAVKELKQRYNML